MARAASAASVISGPLARASLTRCSNVAQNCSPGSTSTTHGRSNSAETIAHASLAASGRFTARGVVEILTNARLVCQGKPTGSSSFSAACRLKASFALGFDQIVRERKDLQSRRKVVHGYREPKVLGIKHGLEEGVS